MAALILLSCAAKRLPPSGTVTWDDAREILCRKDVKAVEQTHGRRVTIFMDGGATYVTQEPLMDLVVIRLKDCGHTEDVEFSTE